MKKLFAIAFALLIPSAAPAADGPPIPVHGNWCGPFHGSGPVLDLLDAACFRHDHCTAATERLDCSCDIEFMEEIRSQAWPNPELATKARAVYEIMAFAPCDDPEEQRLKFQMTGGDWARDVLGGYEPPWAILDRLGDLVREGFSRSF